MVVLVLTLLVLLVHQVVVEEWILVKEELQIILHKDIQVVMRCGHHQVLAKVLLEAVVVLVVLVVMLLLRILVVLVVLESL